MSLVLFSVAKIYNLNATKSARYEKYTKLKCSVYDN